MGYNSDTSPDSTETSREPVFATNEGLNFSSNDHVITIRSAITFRFREDFTILVWVYPTANGIFLIKESHDQL